MFAHRLLFLLALVIGLPTLLTFLALLHSHPRGQYAAEDQPVGLGANFRTFFSYHTPATLFPPSAIISLTDDNSTFFLARPSDFGPSLRSDGLSGQLWIGSGFGGDGDSTHNAEGELGCSDIPGWEGLFQRTLSAASESTDEDGKTSSSAPNGAQEASSDAKSADKSHDGTDDHLHQPLRDSPTSPSPKTRPDNHATPGGPAHADIQSLQETAEIAGKVALLSRGGCGFLEKVKWAQRRGAKAVIVGDHTRGGALVTMYARGDTSNITISSVFTSHTTAHLLSSLIPSDDGKGQFLKPHIKTIKAVTKQTSKRRRSAQMAAVHEKRATSLESMDEIMRHYEVRDGDSEEMQDDHQRSSSFWSSITDFLFRSHHRDSESRRPPSNGIFEGADEIDIASDIDREQKSRTPKSQPAQEQNSQRKGKASKSAGDDFVIGVQDWRDPDLVPVQANNAASSDSKAHMSMAKGNDKAEAKQRVDGTFAGGSITPGSGEYAQPDDEIRTDELKLSANRQAGAESKKLSTSSNKNKKQPEPVPRHEGLWVTLTPTSMSSSPFFDTLLVLVVSPLVTLTLVYALLLLRSRIRRRRWRAPKSIVEQLPIRTYHTMSNGSSTSASRFATPHSSSPTSPLLQSSSSIISNRSRTRPAAATSLRQNVAVSLEKATAQANVNGEKDANQTATKRRKRYYSRQVECVVCLEEYVDGQSQIMSLPCGHEFHAECITPWLTTRRRTCPICKGDVVRSMTQSNSATTGSSSAVPFYNQPSDTEADTQVQALEGNIDASTATLLVPAEEESASRPLLDHDVSLDAESGQGTSSVHSSPWSNLASPMNLGAFTARAERSNKRDDDDDDDLER